MAAGGDGTITALIRPQQTIFLTNMRQFRQIASFLLFLTLSAQVLGAAPLKIHYLVRPVPPTTITAASLRVVIHEGDLRERDKST